MATNNNQPTKNQTFQKACSGYAFACALLFGALQFKSVEVGFGIAFIGVRFVVLSIGFLTFLASGMVGVSSFFSHRSKFKNVATKIVNAFFSDEEEKILDNNHEE